MLLLILVSWDLPALRASQMRVWVRPCVVASARCMQLLVKILVAISMPMKQSSSFEESYPSHVGISCSRVMVMFACIVVCMCSLGLGF